MPPFLRTLLSRLGANHPSVVLQPAPVAHNPAQAAPNDDYSCLIRGVIKSIREEPAKWSIQSRMSYGGESYIYEDHPQLVLYVGSGVYVTLRVRNNITLTDAEQRAVFDVVESTLRAPVRAKEQAALEAATRPTLDHFSRLGCPQP